MQRGIRHVVVAVAGAVGDQPGLHGAHHTDEIRRQMQGVQGEGGQRRMALAPGAGGAQGDLALVAGGDLHVRGLAHDAHAGAERAGGQHVDQRADAEAADFFVIGQREVQRRGQVALAGRDHGRDGAGDEALHVGRATPVKPAVSLGQREGWHGPGLAFDRDDVGVARQHDARTFGAKGGKEVRLAAVRIGDQRHPRASRLQQVADPQHQAEVGFRADRVKGDQGGEDLGGVHRGVRIALPEIGTKLMRPKPPACGSHAGFSSGVSGARLAR